MSNPPKKKGTAYELKVRRQLEATGFRVRRKETNARYDLDVEADPQQPYAGDPVQALFTEPDRGQTLVTVDLNAFKYLLWRAGCGAHIECKKGNTYKAIHTLWKREMTA